MLVQASRELDGPLPVFQFFINQRQQLLGRGRSLLVTFLLRTHRHKQRRSRTDASYRRAISGELIEKIFYLVEKSECSDGILSSLRFKFDPQSAIFRSAACNSDVSHTLVFPPLSIRIGKLIRCGMVPLIVNGDHMISARMKYRWLPGLFVLVVLGLGELVNAAEPDAKHAPLGSLDFKPTPERPVGWRGDWTGRFPGATPPRTWSRRTRGSTTEIRYQADKPTGDPGTPGKDPGIPGEHANPIRC